MCNMALLVVGMVSFVSLCYWCFHACYRAKTEMAALDNNFKILNWLAIITLFVINALLSVVSVVVLLHSEHDKFIHLFEQITEDSHYEVDLIVSTMYIINKYFMYFVLILRLKILLKSSPFKVKSNTYNKFRLIIILTIFIIIGAMFLLVSDLDVYGIIAAFLYLIMDILIVIWLNILFVQKLNQINTFLNQLSSSNGDADDDDDDLQSKSTNTPVTVNAPPQVRTASVTPRPAMPVRSRSTSAAARVVPTVQTTANSNNTDNTTIIGTIGKTHKSVIGSNRSIFGYDQKSDVHHTKPAKPTKHGKHQKDGLDEQWSPIATPKELQMTGSAHTIRSISYETSTNTNRAHTPSRADTTHSASKLAFQESMRNVTFPTAENFDDGGASTETSTQNPDHSEREIEIVGDDLTIVGEPVRTVAVKPQIQMYDARVHDQTVFAIDINRPVQDQTREAKIVSPSSSNSNNGANHSYARHVGRMVLRFAILTSIIGISYLLLVIYVIVSIFIRYSGISEETVALLEIIQWLVLSSDCCINLLCIISYFHFAKAIRKCLCIQHWGSMRCVERIVKISSDNL